MKFDMHCHTYEGSSDGKVPVKEYIELLKSQGFDGMLVTDHDSYKGYEYYENNLKDDINDFVVLKGIEYDTFDGGHFIVILPSYVNLDILKHRGMSVRMLVKLVHKFGGVLGPAHPCGEPFLSIFSTGKFKKNHSVIRDFDFIEGFNSGEDEECNERAASLAKEYGKPALGGSDAHKHDCVGLAYTIFDEDIRTNDELIDYIRKCKHTECGGEKYYGTIKEHLGKFNKLLVYGFLPYNKAGALANTMKRRGEISKLEWELLDKAEHHKEKIEAIEKKLCERYKHQVEQIEAIRKNELFDSMRNHRHHAKVSTLEHSERVAATSAKLAAKLQVKKIDDKAMMRAALLHDFYLYDWHHKDDGSHKWHGYHHADKARENAVEHFDINEKEQEIIRTHMWPLNITRVPRSREAWLVCIADKIVSCRETFLGRKS